MAESKKQKKLALAIRGGMARGLGSISMIRFLEEEGITPHIISGSSSGAMVASAYALGHNWEEIKEMMQSIRITKYFSPLDFPSSGAFVSRKKFLKGLKEIAGVKPGDHKLEDFKSPQLILFAGDRVENKRVLLKEGDLVENLMISSSYPLIMPGPKGSKKHLIDGDFTAGYSASEFREMGADVVIGVGYKPKPPGKKTISNKPLDRILDVYRMVGSEMHDLILKYDPPDIEILYDAGDYSYTNFKEIDKIMYRAYREIRSKRDEILKLLK